MDQIAYTLRFAARSLRARPGFTAVATITLALGIGANTAIYSLVNGILLHPLPYPEPEGLITVKVAPDEPGENGGSMSLPDLADVESDADGVESLVGISRVNRTLTGAGEPLLLGGTRVSRGILETFRLTPALGRDIRADESGAEAATVVVISHGFWKQHFGSGETALGELIELNGVRYEIIGVAPEGFDFPEQSQFWYPRQLDPEGCGRGCHTWQTIGRLAVDANISTARAEIETIAANLSGAYPDTNTDKRFMISSLREDVVGDVSAGLWILLGAVGLVLLIACANVANLLLARASSRRGEVAVRAALGASPARLAAGLLAESLLLALLGGTAGLLGAAAGLRLLRQTSSQTIPRMEMVGIDVTVLLFTATLVLLVTLLFGLSPALRLARVPLAAGLVASGRSASAASGGRRTRSMLTAAEMCLSVVLLVAAGLLLRSFGQLYAVDLGFETRQMLRFSISLPDARYPSLDQVRSTFRGLEADIAALPGVASVGSIYGAPLHRNWSSGTVLVEGRPEPEPSEETGAVIRPVNPEYLDTMRIPLRRGRGLTAADDTGGPTVAVVNEAFVRENFAGENPLGKGVRITVDMGFGSPLWTIVGVVADVRSDSLTRAARAEIYVPHGRFGPAYLTLNVRGVAGSGPLIGPIRDRVRALDPDLPLQEVETIAEVVARQIAPTRFFLAGVGLFAALAVLLAMVGLYGVVAYLVAERTREIGVRIALGAGRGEIVRMVLLDGLRPAAAGLAAGLVIAIAGGRVVEGLLFGVAVRDPLTLATVPLLLTLVAVLAIAMPATRASRVDPIVALKSD